MGTRVEVGRPTDSVREPRSSGPSTRLCLWGIDLETEARGENLGVGFSRVDSRGAAALAPAMGLPPAAVSARLAWSRCYVGRIDDRVVTYGWVSQVETPIGEIAATIRPAPYEAYIWGCATAPEYRVQGRYRMLLRHMVAALAEEKLRQAWIGTLEDNPAGCHAVERAGFHPILRVRYFALRGRCWSVRPAGGATSIEVEALRAALRLGPDSPSRF